MITQFARAVGAAYGDEDTSKAVFVVMLLKVWLRKQWD